MFEGQKDGKRHVIHSLEKFSYLKLGADNFIYYDCESPRDRKICIMQEWDEAADMEDGVAVS